MSFKCWPFDEADVVSVNLKTITKHTARYGPSKAVNTASCLFLQPRASLQDSSSLDCMSASESSFWSNISKFSSCSNRS